MSVQQYPDVFRTGEARHQSFRVPKSRFAVPSRAPHTHNFLPENLPDAHLGPHNFCRNPDMDTTIWCDLPSDPTGWKTGWQIATGSLKASRDCELKVAKMIDRTGQLLQVLHHGPRDALGVLRPPSDHGDPGGLRVLRHGAGGPDAAREQRVSLVQRTACGDAVKRRPGKAR